MKFYIKPQPNRELSEPARGCILLKFYIKPQPTVVRTRLHNVVSYWNSTSNHNTNAFWSVVAWLYLIEILHQTTTMRLTGLKNTKLYLIEILHQTTTSVVAIPDLRCCILLKFYIKPQRRTRRSSLCSGCILLKFYIKPQLAPFVTYLLSVVSYWNSTSNHNSCLCISEETAVVSYWNSTSNHNILPALYSLPSVVSYWNSTSNHNILQPLSLSGRLYLIEILHQTTTSHESEDVCEALYLIEILHQTTTLWG